MKTKRKLISAGSFVFGFCAGILPSLQADVIAYDGFHYPSGISLDTRGYPAFQWGESVWQKQTGPSDWLTISESLSFSTLHTTGGHIAEMDAFAGADYERAFSSHRLRDGGTLWFSFLVKIIEGSTWDFRIASLGDSASYFGVEGSHVNYAMEARIGSGYSGSSSSIILGQNNTRFIVGRYEYSSSENEQIDIWVDPDLHQEPQSGGESSAGHIVHTRQLDHDPDRFDGVLIKQRSIGKIAFDELRIGTSWADVTSQAIDQVSISNVGSANGDFTMTLSRLTPEASTRVERSENLSDPLSWQVVDTFIPTEFEREWTEALLLSGNGFYRVTVE